MILWATQKKVIFETEIDDDETATKRNIAKTPDDICFNWEDADTSSFGLRGYIASFLRIWLIGSPDLLGQQYILSSHR